MASNPYGITQVDIPGLLGMHQQMKRQRLEDLYRAREVQMKEAAFDREMQKQGLLAKLFTGQSKGGDPASASGGGSAPQSATASTTVPAGDGGSVISAADAGAMRASIGDEQFEAWKKAKNVTEEGEGAPVAPSQTETPLPPLDQDLPPRTDGLTINQDVLRQLYALDPEGAMQIQRFVYESDKQRLEQVQKRGEAMAVVASALGSVAPDARAAEIQKWVPYLEERGYSAEQLRGIDLSDAALARFYRQGRTIEQIVQSAEKDRTFEAQEEERRRRENRAEAAEGRAQRAEARSVVRFNERGLDRAALAASGGIRTDTSDLDY